MKKLFIFLLGVILITGCGNPQLSNGEEVLAEIDGFQVTADDVYNELKRMYGMGATVDLIDNFIANLEVETTDEIRREAEETIEMYKAQNEAENWEEILLQAGFQDESELKQLLINNLKKEIVLENFVMRNLDEEAVLTYYENDFHGRMDVRHILIRPDENEEDPEQALTDAYEKAVSIIEKLDDGADFVELVAEYSDDAVGNNDGLIENVNLEEYVDDFFYASRALDIDEYTSEPVQTQFGYHIILKVNQEEKPSFEDAKEEIKRILAQRKTQTADDVETRRLWGELRLEYNLEIHDEEIRGAYNNTFILVD